MRRVSLPSLLCLTSLLCLPACSEEVPLADAITTVADDVAIELATAEAAVEMPVLDLKDATADAKPTPAGGPHPIKVRSGESLALYGRWIGVNPEEIAKANSLDAYGKLSVGQSLTLELGTLTPQRFEERRMAYRKARLAKYLQKRGGVQSVITHTVRKGETVLGIARRHGRLPLWVMRHYNPDRNLDRLDVGDELRVPVTSDRVTARR